MPTKWIHAVTKTRNLIFALVFIWTFVAIALLPAWPSLSLAEALAMLICILCTLCIFTLLLKPAYHKLKDNKAEDRRRRALAKDLERERKRREREERAADEDNFLQ